MLLLIIFALLAGAATALSPCVLPILPTAGRDARIDATFKARRVFLVLGSADRDRSLRVLLDGEPIAAGDAGDDVSDAVATIGEETIYSLVSLPKAGRHTLTLEFEDGLRGYAFTFG